MISSYVKVAEWPPFGRELLNRFNIRSLCILISISSKFLVIAYLLLFIQSCPSVVNTKENYFENKKLNVDIIISGIVLVEQFQNSINFPF